MTNLEPSEAEAAWRAAVDRQLKGADFDAALVSRTRDGIPIGPLHPKADPVAPGPRRDRVNPVRVFARVDHPEAARANALARAEVEGGADGLTLTFAGSGSARGFGLLADALDEVAPTLPLDRVSLRLEPAPFAATLVRGALETLARRGAASSAIDLGLDPLGDMARLGSVPLPWPDLARALAGDLAALRRDGLAAGPSLRADGRPHHEAGASEAQELAAVLATALAYLRALEPFGLEEARDALGFTLAADADQLATMAKLRALRVLWQEVERACGLAPEPLRLHAETAWRMLTRRDPHGNLVRGTIACAAAILGGADTVGVLPFTGALGLADGFARRLARNTALVLLEEAHLGRVADPAAGSGAYEHLTDALCEAAWTLFQTIEREGGMAASLATGAWQERVGLMRDRRRVAIDGGAAPIVGTTTFLAEPEAHASILPVVPEPPRRMSFGSRAACFPALRATRDAEPFELGGTP